MPAPLFSIGVEEEYQIVDSQTRELRPRAHRILPLARNNAAQDSSVQNELFLAQIEIGTPICRTLDEVRAEIKALRRAVIGAARQERSAIVASSTHPISDVQHQMVTPKERYLDMQQFYGQIARDHFICGCHVHIGIQDREAAIQIMNRARGWLATLLAISANSPFWQGNDTDYASFRTELWRRWPMAGSPQVFQSRAEYEALVRTLVATEAISDETKIYWDIRPADRFETLEFRVADIGLTLDDAVLIAGLSRAIAQSCYEALCVDAARGAVLLPVRPELLKAAEWRAARFGLSEQLIDVQAGELVPAAQMVQSLLDFLRPVLENRGEWDEISALSQKVLHDGNGAARQRKVFQQTGDLNAVVDFLVRETARDI